MAVIIRCSCFFTSSDAVSSPSADHFSGKPHVNGKLASVLFKVEPLASFSGNAFKVRVGRSQATSKKPEEFSALQGNEDFIANLSPYVIPKRKQLVKLHSPSCKTYAQSEGNEGPSVSEGTPSSSRTQLDLLEQLTSSGSSVDGYESDGSSSRKLTIRDQLAQLVGDRDDDFSIPLGKNLKKVSEKFLTISQKRNIRRQAYLKEVSRRNDSVFFATIGAFVILPPLVILGIAIITGYVQLFP